MASSGSRRCKKRPDIRAHLTGPSAITEPHAVCGRPSSRALQRHVPNFEAIDAEVAVPPRYRLPLRDRPHRGSGQGHPVAMSPIFSAWLVTSKATCVVGQGKGTVADATSHERDILAILKSGRQQLLSSPSKCAQGRYRTPLSIHQCHPPDACQNGRPLHSRSNAIF